MDERPSIIETLASRVSFAGALLEAIGDEEGTIPRNDVTAVHARQIQSLGNETLTERLSEVWGELRESSGERRKMIESLKIYPLLQGYRGSAPKNIDKLIEVMIRLSYLAADYPEIEELDINPLFVHEAGKKTTVADIIIRLDDTARNQCIGGSSDD